MADSTENRPKPQLCDTPQDPAWLSCQDDKPGFTAAPAAASLPDQPAFQAARALALLGHKRFPTYSRLSCCLAGDPAFSAPLVQVHPMVIPLSLIL